MNKLSNLFFDSIKIYRAIYLQQFFYNKLIKEVKS